MVQNEHKTLDSLCRYITDVNNRGETWRITASDRYIEVVAYFLPAVNRTDDDGMLIHGWIVARGLDESSVLASIIRGVNTSFEPSLDVPFLRGLDESVSAEEIQIRLAALGY